MPLGPKVGTFQIDVIANGDTSTLALAKENLTLDGTKYRQVNLEGQGSIGKGIALDLKFRTQSGLTVEDMSLEFAYRGERNWDR